MRFDPTARARRSTWRARAVAGGQPRQSRAGLRAGARGRVRHPSRGPPCSGFAQGKAEIARGGAAGGGSPARTEGRRRARSCSPPRWRSRSRVAELGHGEAHATELEASSRADSPPACWHARAPTPTRGAVLIAQGDPGGSRRAPGRGACAGAGWRCASLTRRRGRRVLLGNASAACLGDEEAGGLELRAAAPRVRDGLGRAGSGTVAARCLEGLPSPAASPRARPKCSGSSRPASRTGRSRASS